MRYLILPLILVAGCNVSENISRDTDISIVYSSYVSEWKTKVSNAFDVAEKEVFSVKPTPKPDIVGPHPDPAKCICKGTGIIVHGDGHKTPCEYHSGQPSQSKGNARSK